MDNGYRSDSIGQASASVQQPQTILDSILDRQQSHAAELQNVCQRMSDLADRLRGLPHEVTAKAGSPPPKEVPSHTVRKFEMLTEDVGIYIARICEHLSRLEAL